MTALASPARQALGELLALVENCRPVLVLAARNEDSEGTSHLDCIASIHDAAQSFVTRVITLLNRIADGDDPDLIRGGVAAALTLSSERIARHIFDEENRSLRQAAHAAADNGLGLQRDILRATEDFTLAHILLLEREIPGKGVALRGLSLARLLERPVHDGTDELLEVCRATSRKYLQQQGCTKVANLKGKAGALYPMLMAEAARGRPLTPQIIHPDWIPSLAAAMRKLVERDRNETEIFWAELPQRKFASWRDLVALSMLVGQVGQGENNWARRRREAVMKDLSENGIRALTPVSAHERLSLEAARIEEILAMPAQGPIFDLFACEAMTV